MQKNSFVRNKQLLILILLIFNVGTIFLIAIIFSRSKLNGDNTQQLETHAFNNPSPAQGLRIVITDTPIPTPTPNVSYQNEQELQKFFTVKLILLNALNNVSLYYKDNTSLNEVTIDQGRIWNPASIVKIFVALEAYKQRDLKKLNFNQFVTISKNNVVPTELETDAYPTLLEGVSVTIKQLVGAMITQSDNTAYNTLLDILDRRNIITTIQQYGFADTRVGEKLNLDDDQYALDSQQPGWQSNQSSVKDIASFFNLLYMNKLPDSIELLTLLKQQKVNYMLPALLPVSTTIAHKTGEFYPYFHDGGIVFKDKNPFTLIVFSDTGAPNVVSELAKVAFDNTSQSVSNSGIQTFIPPTLQKLKLISAAQKKTRVLGAKIIKASLPLTAADYGMTSADLSIDTQDAQKIITVSVIPGTFFYPLKRFYEFLNIALTFNTTDKMLLYQKTARIRIQEMKTVLKQNKLAYLSRLLYDYEQDLDNAISLIHEGRVPVENIIFVKQTNDLLFATLNENSSSLSQGQEAEFINQIYSFYDKYNKKVSDLINNSIVKDPLTLTPITGKVIDIGNNSTTILLLDGSKRIVQTHVVTPIRAYNSPILDHNNNITIGSEIAVVGIPTINKNIIPFFVLRNIPPDYPNLLNGIVIQITTNPDAFQLQTADGKIYTVVVDQHTQIKSRDSYVAIDGLKIESQVFVSGTYIKKNSILKANAIRVLSNSSGKDEIIREYSN